MKHGYFCGTLFCSATSVAGAILLLSQHHQFIVTGLSCDRADVEHFHEGIAGSTAGVDFSIA
jgi:hypothetical protein